MFEPLAKILPRALAEVAIARADRSPRTIRIEAARAREPARRTTVPIFRVTPRSGAVAVI